MGDRRYRSQLSGWVRVVTDGPPPENHIFLDRIWDRRREEAAIGDVDSERSLKDEALQPPRAAT